MKGKSNITINVIDYNLRCDCTDVYLVSCTSYRSIDKACALLCAW